MILQNEPPGIIFLHPDPTESSTARSFHLLFPSLYRSHFSINSLMSSTTSFILPFSLSLSSVVPAHVLPHAHKSNCADGISPLHAVLLLLPPSSGLHQPTLMPQQNNNTYTSNESMVFWFRNFVILGFFRFGDFIIFIKIGNFCWWLLVHLIIVVVDFNFFFDFSKLDIVHYLFICLKLGRKWVF